MPIMPSLASAVTSCARLSNSAGTLRAAAAAMSPSRPARRSAANSSLIQAAHPEATAGVTQQCSVAFEGLFSAVRGLLIQRVAKDSAPVRCTAWRVRIRSRTLLNSPSELPPSAMFAAACTAWGQSMTRCQRGGRAAPQQSGFLGSLRGQRPAPVRTSPQHIRAKCAAAQPTAAALKLPWTSISALGHIVGEIPSILATHC